VLLTDFIMPEMTGLALVSAARALDATLRCVIMTGHRPPEGAPSDVEWIEKPLDLDKLLDSRL
jgi:DNA-binding NtrC family response regulator